MKEMMMLQESTDLGFAQDAGTGPDTFEVPDTFCVHDDESANWLVRRIVEARVYAERCDAFAARERRRAQQEEEHLCARFLPQLREYVRRKLDETRGRRKSLNLPAGVVGYRTHPEKLIVDDEAAVLAWAREHNPALVATVEKLKKAQLHEHLQKNGRSAHVGHARRTPA